ncbi:hypothetical protein GCM10018952_14500 [Streptosporangium vulgare]
MTCARTAKHDLLRELGADVLIDHTTADFVAKTAPVDVVFDLVAASTGNVPPSRSSRAACSWGRWGATSASRGNARPTWAYGSRW